MGNLFGDQPQPPDPRVVAAAQTSANVSTAVANAFLNNVNQVTPQGNLSYDQTGTYQFTDPTNNATYDIPRFTATQSLTPEQQATLDQTNIGKLNLATLGATQSGRLGGILGSPFDLSTAPQGGSAQTLTNAPYPGYAGLSYGLFNQPPDVQQQVGSLGSLNSITGTLPNTGDVSRNFGDAGDVTRSYGDTTAADERSRVESSLFSRMQPQLDLERSQLEQHLADQGIRYGNPAYTAAMDNYNRQLNDLRLGVVAQGGQEQQLQESIAQNRAQFMNQAQQQAYAQALQRGQFGNQAQQQAYEQALSTGQFQNQAQQQAYQQALQSGQFANQAQQQRFAQEQSRSNLFNNAVLQQQQMQEQIFNAQQSARQQYLAEQYAYRNQPINEISALMSGSQVSMPNFITTSEGKIPTTDVAGLINNRFTQEQQNYQQANQNMNQLIGGIFGAAAGYLKSDVREKENIHRIGTVMTADNTGGDGEDMPLPVYQYSYKDDPMSRMRTGPMAQDVEKTDPEAVHTIRGTKYIDTSRVLGGILRAA